jgi:zinc protease
VYWTHICNATPQTVREACRRWLNPQDLVVVGLVPEASAITEDQVLKACESGFKMAAFHPMAPALIAASTGRKHQNADKALVTEIKPGIKLVYKHNPQGKLFSLVAASEGGLRGESKEEAGLYCSMTALLAKASRDYSYEEMLGVVENLGATLDGFSGKDSFGMQFHCLTEQVDVLLDLFASALEHPVFPSEQWTSTQREILEAIKAKDDSPGGVCIRSLQEQMFGDHPYSRPTYGTREVVGQFTAEHLQQRFIELRDEGPWVISCVGSLDPAEIVAKLSEALKAWTPRTAARTFASDKQLSRGTPSKKRINKDREQSHLAIGFPGINWADPDRAPLDVLVNILGGHGGRLFRKLRDRDSLAYSVSPIVSYGKHPGAVGSYIACAPGKVDQAVASLKREMLTMVETPPTEEETDRSKNHIVGSHEMDLQRSDAQAMTMALMELYGLGHDDFRSYPKLIEKVTPKDVHRVASRLLLEPLLCEVIVGNAGSPS